MPVALSFGVRYALGRKTYALSLMRDVVSDNFGLFPTWMLVQLRDELREWEYASEGWEDYDAEIAREFAVAIVREVERRENAADDKDEGEVATVILSTDLPLPVTYDRKLKIFTAGQDKSYWMTKSREEMHEIDSAKTREERAEEIMDEITVCVSHLASMGYDLQDRLELARKVNEKNRKRGCFQVEAG